MSVFEIYLYWKYLKFLKIGKLVWNLLKFDSVNGIFGWDLFEGVGVVFSIIVRCKYVKANIFAQTYFSSYIRILEGNNTNLSFKIFVRFDIDK